MPTTALPDPLAPEQQAELRRWRTLDFQPAEADHSSYRSPSRLAAIGACGRSGTTLLRRMLGGHSQLADSPESFLFLPVPIQADDLAARFGLDPALVHDLLRQSTSRAAFIDAFQSAYLALRQRLIWVDKTSRNVHCFAAILRHFPHARLIHVIRDPRDVVCSLRTHPLIRKGDPERRATGWLQPWQDCIDRWRLAIDDGLRLRGHPAYREVRYEDLVHNSETVLRSLCDFLGVAFEPQMLLFHQRPEPTDLRFIPNNRNATLPLSDRSIGRWRQELSPPELALVQEQLGAYLPLLGYSA